MEINEEKRNKFMEYAGKRVNNVLHDMQILEPMARSNSYDFTKEDVEEMFGAMQSTLNDVRAEFNKKFEEKARNEKKVFSFGNTKVVAEKGWKNDKNVTIHRFKGLGEMMPAELWSTTMNPEQRKILKVTLENAATANEIFADLMGEKVEPRKEFINVNAKFVQNLDI